MGKASSNKKVARAARAGGRASSGQPRSLLFPGVLALVIVLGTSLVVYARDDRQSDDMGGVPQIGDHIHQSIAFVVCGEGELPALPEFESTIGIHTHGDGVIHIHPFSQLGVGANATLDRYLEDVKDEGGVDITLTNDELEYFGETYAEDQTECEGVEDPQLRMAYWPDVQDEASEPQVTTGGFGDRRLTTDGAGMTIFFGDPDADIPKPANASQLAELGARDANPSATTTTPAAGDGATTTTVATDPNATTTVATTPTTVAP
ncbi:MAG TPA: hypothetical protein VJ804_11200 [Acidimicrobiales bacterium]|nr:hypothetical protein [Acidimicrobiales bacterium]